jgi:hypothetical protein
MFVRMVFIVKVLIVKMGTLGRRCNSGELRA